jgi:hypothetical protein
MSTAYGGQRTRVRGEEQLQKMTLRKRSEEREIRGEETLARRII